MPIDPNDPEVAAYLRRMGNKQQRLEAQMEALNQRYQTLAAAAEDDKIELKRLAAALKKAASRIRYIEDIPGKRVPYFLGFQINVPGQSNPTVSLTGSRLSDTKQVSMDGPFVCTTYLSAFLLRCFSLGPYDGTEDAVGRPNDPEVGSEVQTPLSGRFRPVASSADPFSGAYIGMGIGGIPAAAANVAAAQAVQTFRPGTIDFLFEVADEGVDRLRQNQVPIPSRYLFSEFDRPLYLPVSDFFERGSAIRFAATLTRDIGFAEINYASLPNGFQEGGVSPPPDPIANNPTESGRMIVALGGTLYFTMLGYKILQAQSPAV
jgi:hypothetical protein